MPEDVGDLEAKLRVVLDDSFRAELRKNLTREFAALGDRIDQTLGRAIGGAVGSGLRDARKQMRVFGGDIAKPLADAARDVRIADPLQVQAGEIHTVVQKIIVDFTELASAVRDRSQATREYLDGILYAQANRPNVEADVQAQRRQTRILEDALRRQTATVRTAATAQQQSEFRQTAAARAAATERINIARAEGAERVAAARAAGAEVRQTELRLSRELTDARNEGAKTRLQTVEQQARNREASKAAQLEVLAERRKNDALKAEDKRRLAQVELVNSQIRIREQAAQQRSLARTQQFYRLTGDAARRAGNVALSAAGTIAGRLLPLERRANNDRVDDYRRASDRIAAAERSGADRSVSTLRAAFTRRHAEEIAGYRRSETLATEAQARFSRGVLGTATGNGPLTGILPITAGVGLTAGLVKGLDVANDFTTALAVLREASGATSEQMDRVRVVAKELGNDVKLPGVSAADAANAMRILATSGVDVEQSLDGVAKAVLQLSRATKVDAEEAARAEAAAVNVFRLTGQEALRAADGLALAKIQSGASLAELSDALQQSALQFNATFRGVTSGIDNFAQLNATLAVFAKNGLRGSDAGTSLKTALQAMTGRSKQAQRELDNVAHNAGVTGTVLFDAQGRTRKFSEAIYILKAGLAGLNDQERAKSIQQIFGSDASRAATLIIDNAEAISKVTAETIKGGTAARLAAAENAGWRGGLDALTSTLETLALDGLGGKLQGALRATLVGFSTLLTNLAQGTGVWAVARAGLVGVAGGLAAIVAAKGAVEVLGLLRVGLRSLSSPAGIAGLALVGLGGALGVLVSKSPQARESLSRLRATASDFISNVGDRLSGVFGAVAVGAERLGGVVLPALEDALGAVAGFAERNLGPALSRVGGFIEGLGGRIAGAVSSIAKGFAGSRAPGFFFALGRAAATATRYVVATLTVVRDLVAEGYRGVTGGGGLIGFLRGVGETAADVVTLVRQLGSNISDAVTGGGSIGDRLGRVFAGIGPIVNDVLGGIPEQLGHLVRTGIIDPVKAEFNQFFGTGAPWYIGLLGLVRDVGLRLGRTITAAITDRRTLTVVGTVLASVASTALAATQGFVQGVIEKLLDRLRSILPDFFKGLPIVGPLLGAFEGAVKPISAVISTAIIGGIAVKTLSGPLSRLGGFIGSLLGRTTRQGIRLAFRGDQAGLDRLISDEAKRATNQGRRASDIGSAFGGPGGSVIGGVAAGRAALEGLGQTAGRLRARLASAAETAQIIGLYAADSARRASPTFDRLATSAGRAWTSIKDKASTAFTAIGVGAITVYEKVGGLRGIFEGAVAAAGGFFSGLAAASGDATTRIGGISSAILGIGTLLATGNPILAGIAAIGTAFGFIVGRANEAKAKMKELRAEATTIAETLVRSADTGDASLIRLRVLDDVRASISDLGDNYDELRKKAPGIGDALTEAFNSAAVGDFDGAIVRVRRSLSGFQRQTTTYGDLIQRAFKNAGKEAEKFGSLDALKIGVFAETRADAEKLAVALRNSLRDLVLTGKESARSLFDTFAVVADGDRFKVIQRGFKDIPQDALNKIGEQLVAYQLAVKAANGDQGKVIAARLELEKKITEETQKRQGILLDEPTFIERINSRLADVEQRTSDILGKLRDAFQADFSDYGDQIANIASSVATAATDIKANKGVLSDPFNTSDTAKAARSSAREIRSAFQQQAAAILAQPGITADAAQQQIAALQANLIDVARKAGADQTTLNTIRDQLKVPDLTLADDSIKVADDEALTRAARTARDEIQREWANNHAQLPVDLVPFVNANTPEGEALRSLIDTGFFGGAARSDRRIAAGQSLANPNNPKARQLRFARGDVVRRPTLGVFGEAGPEVILPLSKPDRIAKLAHDALSMAGRDPLVELAKHAAAAGGSSVPQFAGGAIFQRDLSDGSRRRYPTVSDVGVLGPAGKGPDQSTFRTREGRDLIDRRRVRPLTDDERRLMTKTGLDVASGTSVKEQMTDRLRTVGFRRWLAEWQPRFGETQELEVRLRDDVRRLDTYMTRAIRFRDYAPLSTLAPARDKAVRLQRHLATLNTSLYYGEPASRALVNPVADFQRNGAVRGNVGGVRGARLARGKVVRQRMDGVTLGESGVEVVTPVNDPNRAQTLLDDAGLLNRLPAVRGGDAQQVDMRRVERLLEQLVGVSSSRGGEQVAVTVSGPKGTTAEILRDKKRRGR